MTAGYRAGMLWAMNSDATLTRDESAPARDATSNGQVWEVNLPILGGWVRVTVRGYLDGPSRTKQRVDDETKMGRLSHGLTAPDKRKKKTKKQLKEEAPAPGTWSLLGAWKIDPPMLHGCRAPWGWIVDSGQAQWRRPQ